MGLLTLLLQRFSFHKQDLDAAILDFRCERSDKTPSPPKPPPAGCLSMEEGTFRVNTAAALKTLRERRLSAPESFLLSWVRCGVASGAKRIEVRRTGDGILMSFDGSPLPPETLEAPYDCLFGPESSGSEPARYLAWGILGAQRFKPDLIRVSSGPAAKRASLRMGPRAETYTRGEPGYPMTVLEIALPRSWLRGLRAGRWLKALGPLFPSDPIEFVVEHVRIPEADSDREWAYRAPAGSGPRISHRMPWIHPEGAARNIVDLYKHGVFAGRFHYGAPIERPYHALVSDDGVRLDLSGEKAVQDERLLYLLDWVDCELSIKLSRKKAFRP